jgi:hypothetical protein
MKWFQRAISKIVAACREYSVGDCSLAKFVALSEPFRQHGFWKGSARGLEAEWVTDIGGREFGQRRY